MDKLPVGQKVLSGVFEFYDSKGFPLPDLFDYLKSHNCIPCWVSFVRSSKESGWRKKTVLSRVKEAIIDVYGIKFWTEFEEKFQTVLHNEYGE